jgi:aminopeptidase
MTDAPFASLFQTNMGVSSGETILIFTDTIRSDESVSPGDRDRRARLTAMAGDAAEFARRRYGACRFVTFPATVASGAEPPEELWRGALGDATVDQLKMGGLLERLLTKNATPDDLAAAWKIVTSSTQTARVIVALANNSTSHTRFRSLMNAAGCRYASLPHFDPEMLFTSMQVEWQELAVRTRRVAGLVTRAVRVTLTTPDGTNLVMGVAGRTAKSDDGLLTAPGSFGNLPAGEAFLAPVEGTTEGILAITFAPTRKLSSPLLLEIRQGNVVGIRGDDPYRERLEEKFRENPLNRNIAELGIGTNEKATRPDNVLEAEKILGTVHIALGDNAGFGGRVSTPFHEDYVLYGPTLTLEMPDGSQVLLLDDGKLLVEPCPGT